MSRKKIRVLWTVALAIVILVTLNQLRFVDHSKQIGADKNLDENKTVFMTINESSPSIKKSGFSGLQESLKMWNFDKEKEIVYIKEKSLIPTENTPLLIIQNKGNDKYSYNQNIMPINTFPFSMENKGSSIVVKAIKKDGTVTFTYHDKQLALKQGQKYTEFFIEGYKVKKVTIRNYGQYEQKQFKQLKKQDKKQ